MINISEEFYASIIVLVQITNRVTFLLSAFTVLLVMSLTLLFAAVWHRAGNAPPTSTGTNDSWPTGNNKHSENQPRENIYQTEGATCTIHITTTQGSFPVSLQNNLGQAQYPKCTWKGTEFKVQDRWNSALSLFPQGCCATHPRIGNASFGVLKGWQQPHCQVMSQVQQLIVIILNGHVTKGLLGVCNDDVGRQQASQNPVGKENSGFQSVLKLIPHPNTLLLSCLTELLLCAPYRHYTKWPGFPPAVVNTCRSHAAVSHCSKTWFCKIYLTQEFL